MATRRPPVKMPMAAAPAPPSTRPPSKTPPPATGATTPATHLPLQLKNVTRRPGVRFDTPSFARWMYKGTYGIDIGHSVQQQKTAGKAVDRAHLQWGDLLFFTGDEHVGIYIDGGMFLQTPKTGDVIKLSPLAGRADFVEARRIFTPPR